MQWHDIFPILHKHRPADDTEAAFLRQTLDFVARTPAFSKRSTAEGHVTVSGWIIDASATRALLIHHAKLDRWLQPGGHLEPEDASLAAGAAREALEETGLRDLLCFPDLFDIDIHAIPQRGTEPGHLHYDCRFLFQAPDNATVILSDEARGHKWLPIREILTITGLPDSLRRMALKTGRLSLAVRQAPMAP